MSLATDLAGKRAIVTGGAVGIGRAIVLALAACSVRVAVLDRDRPGAERTAADAGGGAVPVQVDVRRRDSVERAFAEVERALGGYEILVANAGVSTMNRAVDLTDEEWDYNFDVNIRGVFLTNQMALRHFLARRVPGVVVNVASMAGKIGAPLLAHYSASKFAVIGWTQAVAREVAGDGIRVNAVCPGFVRTGMQEREVQWEARLRGLTPERVLREYVDQTPLGRLETPEDVAPVVVFLASDAARFVTGEAVNVTGGARMD